MLVDPNGTWLDSYPSVSNGTSWTVPGVSVLSGDRILFVGASGTPSTPSEAWLQTGVLGDPAVFGGN